MPRCSSCGATIIFATHPRTGRAMPINPDPDPAGNIILDFEYGDHKVLGTPEQRAAYKGDLHISHFATCPDAKEHRKP